MGAYRERYGITSDRQPLGPEPGTTSPEARAEWHNAFPAITHAGGDELDTKTDGQLLTWLTAAERALARQPVNVTAELRATRTFHDDSLTAAAATARNAEAAEKAGEDAWAQVHADAAAGLAMRRPGPTAVLGQLETIQGGYDAWEATETPTLDRGTVARTALQRRGVAADYGVPTAPEPLTGPASRAGRRKRTPPGRRRRRRKLTRSSGYCASLASPRPARKLPPASRGPRRRTPPRRRTLRKFSPR